MHHLKGDFDPSMVSPMGPVEGPLVDQRTQGRILEGDLDLSLGRAKKRSQSGQAKKGLFSGKES